MFNKGDKIELIKDTTFTWGTLNEGAQGTFIEYIYGFECEGEFLEFSSPSCRVRLDNIEGTCVTEEYEIKKVQE